MTYKQLIENLEKAKSHKCFSEDDEIEVFDETSGNFYKINSVRQYDGTGDLVIVLGPED